MPILRERPHPWHVHAPHTISEPEQRPLDIGGLLARGAIAGIVAGMAFLLAMMWFAVSQGKPGISPLYKISTVFHASTAPVLTPTEPVLGLTIHIVLSFGFGMGFAVLLVPWLRNLLALVLGGLGAGLALWVLNIQILGRTLFPAFAPKGPSDLIFGLVDHVLIFGLLLVPFFLGRSFERTSRAETRPSATAGRMAPPETRRRDTGQ
jgi:hypothetical protein